MGRHPRARPLGGRRSRKTHPRHHLSTGSDGPCASAKHRQCLVAIGMNKLTNDCKEGAVPLRPSAQGFVDIFVQPFAQGNV